MPESFFCPNCSYDWGSPANLSKHLSRKDCEFNLLLRQNIATGRLQTIFLPVGSYLDIVERAGVELWQSPDGSSQASIPYWIYLVCAEEWLGNYRVMFIENLIRDPRLYIKFTHRSHLLKPYLRAQLLLKTSL